MALLTEREITAENTQEFKESSALRSGSMA
jgi:hypothetical protein